MQKNPNSASPGGIDLSIVVLVSALLGLGVVFVYSSSFIFATEQFKDGHYFFRRQVVFAGLGMGLMLMVAYFPWRWISKLLYAFYIVSLIALGLTLWSSFSHQAGGAFRWLKFPGGLQFEPAEFFKVSFICLLGLFVKDYFFQFPPNRQVESTPSVPKDFTKLGAKADGSIEQDLSRQGRIWFMRFCLLLLPFFILLKQPDFGTAFILFSLTIFVVFIFGLSWLWMFFTALFSAPLFYFFVWQVPYRKSRILALFDPWGDAEAKGFQIIQSMISFAKGGFFGVGLGRSEAKLFFLPEAHTDFIFAVYGEELGLLGVLFLLALYFLVIFKFFQIAYKESDWAKKTIVLGVLYLIGISVFINMGMSLGVLPPKGLTLPFLSYGGSSLISLCFAVGLVLNIEREQNKRQIGF